MFKWIDRHIKWVFTIPTVLIILFLVVFPLAYTFFISFFDWGMSGNAQMKFVGLDNYRYLFASARFWEAVGRTFLFSAVGIGTEGILGVALALYLNREFKGKNMVKTAFLLPMVATPVAVRLVCRLIYEPSIGIANQICMWLGVGRQPWLGALDMALWALLIVDIWQWTPMVMLVVLAGATALPLDVLESAQVDGAGKWQLVRNIILPLLRPAILTALLLRMIDILKTFDLIYSTTQGGPGYATETLNILSYREAFEYFKFGRASATLVVFFLTVFLIAIVFIKFKNKVEVEY